MSRHRRRSCRGKRRYRDRNQALHALRLLTAHSTRTTIPIRAYPCPACNGWHVTSQPHRNETP